MRLNWQKVSGFAHPKFRHHLISTERIPFSGCWIWMGAIAQQGYGRYGKDDEYAHRLVYEYLIGPIQEGLFVCHKCDVPCCVNPDHLFLGTNADNNADMARKGRARKARGEDKTNSKLTEETVLAIRAEYRAWDRGASLRALARKYGIKDTTVWGVVRRETWKHI